ncbi:MAG: class I SAM-dependent RNA methyltransferase [Oscillospiraceae bacterium]|nr:class I SAM-dependent RNA methyltransferase [Oscillospiraceae bacterium]
MTLACPCHFGLESVLNYEIKKIGGEDITVTDGRITFSGTADIIARANLCLSTAERVLIQLAEFKAYSFEELFQGVKQIPWENFISKNDAFPVKGHSLNSALHSVPDCQSIIKKAAVDRLSSKYNISWFQETGPVHQIQFSILKDNVTIYLDTSGAGLHKRGYRKNSNAAPIKETLAAGIIDLARIRENTQFYDPFCGSGTFLIEAAYKALNIAPGIKRTFAAEKWDCFSPEIWKNERQNALAAVKKDNDFFAYGYDIDPECVELAQNNCAKAGVRNRVRIECADVSDFHTEGSGVIVCNPPYGERLLELKQAEELYTKTGQVFRSLDNGSKYYIISPHEDFERFFGKNADKRRKLYNGMIKCQLYMYFK